MGTARAAQLASLAERGDVVGLEAALDALEGDRGDVGGGDGDASAPPATPPAAPAPPHQHTPTPWHPPRRGVTLAERDAVALLTAVCRLASREGGAGAGDAALAPSRALAADLLTSLLEGQGHGWDAVRPAFADALRRPLSLVLLRAAASPPGAAPASAGAALLAAALRLRPLRAALKAEVGAFYPLLILRPAEAEWWSDAGATAGATAALCAARSVAASPQALIDLFVNFDCDLHSANLVERTLKAASRAAVKAVAGAAPTIAAAGAGADVLAAAATALDAWAAPLTAPLAAAEAEDSTIPAGDDAIATAAAAAALTAGRPPSAASLASADDGTAALADVAPPPGRDSSEGGGAALPPNPSTTSPPSEAAAFAAAKERKHSLAAGVAVFNRSPAAGIRALVASGCVPPDPTALASFLRDRADEVDPTSLGELFGSPDATHVDILRAYARLPAYTNLPLDRALRVFLSGFRLPGEAQQIDRIVQAFADAYAEQAAEAAAVTRSNPGALASADTAYLVSFALVMLNTDAHHPAAPASLTADDFAGMCDAAAGGGLPRAELDGMFSRVVAEEIAPPRRPGDASAAAAAARPANAAARLAAALGLPSGGGGASSRWDKGAAATAERARALAAARAALDAGAGAAHLWHEATHAEHARPVLLVGGDAAVRGLAAAVAAAPDGPSAQPSLTALSRLIILGAALGADAIVDGGMAALAAAGGLDAPPVRGAPRESVGVAAVATLLATAAGPAASGLGGGWVPVLRVLSRLDELAAVAAAADGDASTPPGGGSAPRPPTLLTPHETPDRPAAGDGGDGDSLPASSAASPGPAIADGSPARVAGGGLAGGPAVAAAAVAAGAPPPPPPPRSSAFARLFGGVGLVPDAAAASSPANGEHVFRGPGAALVDWVTSPAGAAAAASVLTTGPSLRGEGGVVYARALAAVGTEELAANPPRLWALAALAAAAATAARGVRAHAARVWAVAGAHLAAAACGDAVDPATAAVASAARLVDGLLPRAGGAACALGAGDLLKPLEAAARGGASPAVREAAVAAVGRALASHGRRLSAPGWTAALRVVTAGACDAASPSVVAAALDAAAPAIESLYRAPGARGAAVVGLAVALGATMRNPAHEQLSVGAAFALQNVARSLAAASADDCDAPLPASPRGGDATPTPWDAVLAAFASVARHDPRPVVADAAAAAAAEAAAECAPRWSTAAWRAYGGHTLRYTLDLPARPDDAPPVEEEEDGTPRPAAPRPVGWSTEGVARLLRHARAHAPRAAALVGAHLPSSSPALRPLLSLMVRYCLAPDARAAAAGAALLQAVVEGVAGKGDDKAWRDTRRALRAATRGDVLTGLSSDVAGRGDDDGATGGASTPLGALPPGPDAGTAAGAARTRARSALLTARALGAALATVAAAVPPPPPTRLDDMAAELAASSARAAAVNRDAGARAAVAALLSGGESPPPPPTDADADDYADALADSWAAPPAPGLVRQEAEGGALLLAALRARAAAAPGNAAASAALLAAAAGVLAGAGRSPAPPPSHHADAPPPLPPSWREGATAPLVVAALDAAAAAPPRAWAAAGQTLLPSLVSLATDERPSVRAALAGLLEARVAPLVVGRGG